MIYYENPFDGSDISINSIAAASYALKLANDDYFGVYYQGQEMLKELARLGEEVFNQKYELIKPYLPQQPTTSDVEPPKVIPNPLPSNVPASVKAAMNFLDSQYTAAESYFQAELANNTSELKNLRKGLEDKIAAWFKGEMGKAWLGGRKQVTLSGCTLTYTGGNVTFEYAEMPYD